MSISKYMLQASAGNSGEEYWIATTTNGSSNPVTAHDEDGNVYLAYETSGVQRVVKLNRRGEQLWARALDRYLANVVSIDITQDGDVSVVGGEDDASGGGNTGAYMHVYSAADGTRVLDRTYWAGTTNIEYLVGAKYYGSSSFYAAFRDGHTQANYISTLSFSAAADWSTVNTNKRIYADADVFPRTVGFDEDVSDYFVLYECNSTIGLSTSTKNYRYNVDRPLGGAFSPDGLFFYIIGMESASYYRLFKIRVSDGVVIWGRQLNTINSAFSPIGYDNLAVAPDGNIYFTLQPQVGGSTAYRGGAVSSFDPDGNHLWTNAIYYDVDWNNLAGSIKVINNDTILLSFRYSGPEEAGVGVMKVPSDGSGTGTYGYLTYTSYSWDSIPYSTPGTVTLGTDGLVVGSLSPRDDSALNVANNSNTVTIDKYDV